MLILKFLMSFSLFQPTVFQNARMEACASGRRCVCVNLDQKGNYVSKPLCPLPLIRLVQWMDTQTDTVMDTPSCRSVRFLSRFSHKALLHILDPRWTWLTWPWAWRWCPTVNSQSPFSNSKYCKLPPPHWKIPDSGKKCCYLIIPNYQSFSWFTWFYQGLCTKWLFSDENRETLNQRRCKLISDRCP